MLPFAAALDARQLQRFKNEAQAAAHLHHTNIVPVYAVGSERGVHFYAMQLIEGQNLAALIGTLRSQTAPPGLASTGPYASPAVPPTGSVPAAAPDTRPVLDMQTAAQRHSEEMSLGDYFEHKGLRGGTPLSRMRAAGYVYSSQIGFEVGENLGWGTLWLATPRAIVAAWMASAGHRENILDGRYRDTAIGVSPHPPASLAHGQAGAIYTQDFGVIVTG